MPSGPGLSVFEAARPSRVTVTAFGYLWPIETGSAFQWLGAVGIDYDSLHGVFPGLATDDCLDDLWELRELGDFDKRCTLAARAALGRAAGKDWWWALNMTKKILGGWPIMNGIMLREGISPRDLELSDYLDSVYSLLWERSKDEDRMKLDIELAMLPKGVRVKQSSAAKKAMLAAFAAD